jgi:hypothetical protein
MLGKRKAFRIKRSFYVKWSVLGQGLKGEGKVTNVSLLGMDLTIYTHIVPPENSIFLLEGDVSFPHPKKAKIIWSQKLVGGMQGVHYGLKFVDSVEE